MSEIFLTVDGYDLRRPEKSDRDFFVNLTEGRAVPAESDPVDREEAYKIFDWIMEMWAKYDLGPCIVENDEGIRVGVAGLKRASVEGVEVLDLGMTLEADHRNKGLGTTLAEALIEWGHDRSYGIAAHTVEDNKPALHLLNKLGFVRSLSSTISFGNVIRTGYKIFLKPAPQRQSDFDEVKTTGNISDFHSFDDGDDLINNEDWDEDRFLDEDFPFHEEDDFERPGYREIEKQNEYLLRRQSEFREAANYITNELNQFSEITRIFLIGSVAKPLKEEVPRFRRFKRHGIKVLHECMDVDLAVWMTDLGRLEMMRKAVVSALQKLQSEKNIGVASHQAEVFIFKTGTDNYLGRLCKFNRCPKGKPDCDVPGCGDTLFLKQHEDFIFHIHAIAPENSIVLFDREHS